MADTAGSSRRPVAGSTGIGPAPGGLARIEGAARLWDRLRRDAQLSESFDPSTVADLPPPACRLLTHAIPSGAPLADSVGLEMEGSIRLGGRWFPFTAVQILTAGVGFVWAPTVGRRIMRFDGADLLGPDGARMEFRLHGIVPVVRASGTDVARSACGRLAGETVAWLPQALTPQCGARWSEVDACRAVVSVAVPAGVVDVEVTVDDDGRLTHLMLRRWNAASTPPAEESFGGTVATSFELDDGISIAGAGTVAWHPDRPDTDGEFFRYRIVAAHRLGPRRSR